MRVRNQKDLEKAKHKAALYRSAAEKLAAKINKKYPTESNAILSDAFAVQNAKLQGLYDAAAHYEHAIRAYEEGQRVITLIFETPEDRDLFELNFSPNEIGFHVTHQRTIETGQIWLNLGQNNE